jgi:hypothetical protein
MNITHIRASDIVSFPNHLVRILSPSVLLTLNIYFFAPHQIYQGNPTEFKIAFPEIVMAMFPYFVFSMILITVVGVLLPRRTLWYPVLLFGLGILTWVQSGFLMWNYGELDGRGVDWSLFRWHGWFDALVWAVILILCIVFRRRLIKAVTFISLSLICLQAGAAMLITKELPDRITRNNFAAFTSFPETMALYSSQLNIIHIIMDNFQTDVFEELIDELDLSGKLDGFVLFRENAGCTNQTTIALPTILSGNLYDGAMLSSEYYNESIEKGIPSILIEHGYNVNLMPCISIPKINHSQYFQIPSVYKGDFEHHVLLESARLIDISLFRVSPDRLRRLIYNYNNWLVSSMVSTPHQNTSFRHRAFFKDYIHKIRSGSQKPAYHFIHLMPPHPPYMTRADGSYAGRVLANTRENYKNEARETLLLFFKLLDRLHKLNLYDSSAIILQGDHGSEISPVSKGEEIHPCLPRLPALLLVKRPGCIAPYYTSMAYTSTWDTAATLAEMIGLPNNFNGRSVFTITDNSVRNRPFIIFDSSTRPPTVMFYTITGSVYDSGACRLDEELEVSADVQHYTYGTSIQFGMAGRGEFYALSGWGAQHGRHCWSIDHSASLVFRIDKPKSDLILSATFIPNVHPGAINRQRILVKANGLRIDSWEATEREKITFKTVIPQQLADEGVLVLDFELPDAISPAEAGTGADTRILGIALISIKIAENIHD